MKKDIYQIITDQVIKGLQDKGLEWFKPWTGDGLSGLAISHNTGKPYKSINQFMLSYAIAHFDYKSNEFITFNQAISKKGKVKKGATSHMVVFWNVSFSIMGPSGKLTYFKKLSDIPSDLQDQANRHLSPRYYRVFNLDDVEGVTDKWNTKEAVKGTIFEPREDADQIYAQMPKKPKLTHGGNKAFYMPEAHAVRMPEQDTFLDGDSYYKTLFHELVHSTGHKDLLNRKTLVNNNNFGSKTYSQEELVAEMGTMFLISILGLKPKNSDDNSQAYINGWIKHLKNHTKEILFASGQSTKAIEYILNVKS